MLTKPQVRYSTSHGLKSQPSSNRFTADLRQA
jgi:hypothetical protein